MRPAATFRSDLSANFAKHYYRRRCLPVALVPTAASVGHAAATASATDTADVATAAINLIRVRCSGL